MPPRATKPVTPEPCCLSRVGDRQVTGFRDSLRPERSTHRIPAVISAFIAATHARLRRLRSASAVSHSGAQGR
jgi:hypothetical protein